jgi:hypothetical protein
MFIARLYLTLSWFVFVGAYVEEDLCVVGLVGFPGWVLYKLQDPNTCLASPGGQQLRLIM